LNSIAADREAAIDGLGRTLALYTELGATWDARRVRSRLRELGVRRRLIAAEPETNGWTALTTSELTVARLVADGLTNREVAERLFVSPHTVSSHLRHVFSKLGIILARGVGTSCARLRDRLIVRCHGLRRRQSDRIMRRSPGLRRSLPTSESATGASEVRR
jgi:DNA-binding CsgD family transcriptional regulator